MMLRPMRHRFFTGWVLVPANPGHADALRRRGFIDAVEPADAPPLRATDVMAEATPSPPAAPSGAALVVRARSAAERMRASRARRREGKRMVRLELGKAEIAALVRAGLLADAARDDPAAIGEAIGHALTRWPI